MTGRISVSPQGSWCIDCASYFVFKKGMIIYEKRMADIR